MRKISILAGVALALAASASAHAADISSPACAVSGPNGKVSFEGGALDGTWTDPDTSSQMILDGVGSFSMPLGCALGLQLDVGAGDFGVGSAMGAGAHLFMRDPSSYLLGIHSTYESWNFDAPFSDVKLWTLAAEGELYMGSFSLEGEAGLMDTNLSSSGFAGRLTAAYYLNDDLRMSLGVHQFDDFTTGIAAAEWQMPDMPLSLTLEGQMGENGYTAATAGLKFYFGGEQKTLIRRHREDDPADGLLSNAGGAATAGGVLGDECMAAKFGSGSKPFKNCGK
jgi:opacity protein-like surface antigen